MNAMTGLSGSACWRSWKAVSPGTLRDRMPRLSLRTELAPARLPVVFGWVTTYADKPDPDILDLAIWALRDLAEKLDDQSTVTAWFSIALAYADKCRPHDRQRLL